MYRYHHLCQSALTVWEWLPDHGMEKDSVVRSEGWRGRTIRVGSSVTVTMSLLSMNPSPQSP